MATHLSSNACLTEFALSHRPFHRSDRRTHSLEVALLTCALLAGSLCLGPITGTSSLGDTIDIPAIRLLAPAVDDTVRRRKKVVDVEYSDWYNRRLTVHRWASYLTLPLFAANYVTGTQLLEYGNRAPTWAINAHGPLAAGVTALFGVNTLTGGWNLIAARHDPHGRAWRTTHALLMLTADAGFAAAGVLSNEAERSDSRRRLHRAVAIGSIGTATLSYVIMLPPFRRD